jgi:DNA-directed RNA polymerase subunit RPC12/RpoP
MQMVTMYIYASREPVEEMTWYHCFNCKRVLFKVNSQKMLVSNAYGIGFKEAPPSSIYMEYQCHSCKALYNILYM